MPKKYKKRKPRKRINKSIYKSNINKQHVKVNVHTGSTPSGVSYMQAPAYPNLTYINSTIKGTMQELLKEHHQQIPINKPVPPANNPLNRFENTHQQTYPLGDILDEIKKEPRNSFEGCDDGSPINSEAYKYDEPASIF